MRISDWSSDVCSSDLEQPDHTTYVVRGEVADRRAVDGVGPLGEVEEPRDRQRQARLPGPGRAGDADVAPGRQVQVDAAECGLAGKIGRASCRESGCRYG